MNLFGVVAARASYLFRLFILHDHNRSAEERVQRKRRSSEPRGLW